MFRFSVSKDTKKTIMIKEEFQHILKYLLPLIVKKKLKNNVEQGRVVTKSNTIKHYISFLV